MDLYNYLSTGPEELELTGHTQDYQLLKVYAYNAYFNADINNTEDVNNGCTYCRDQFKGIDGIYINQTLEENTIECLYSYVINSGTFDLANVYNTLGKISAEIKNVKNNRFVGNKKADDLLKEYLEESENKKIIIRVITDYICEDEKEKYELNKKIENYVVSVPGLNVTSVIQFGDDIIATIESNRSPYDYVEKNKLILDSSNNFLKFGDHSIVCNISAKSLKELWKKEGTKGLLAMNLRYYIKSTNIDDKIENSIMYEGDNFWYLNNGIIIVCNDYNVVGNEVRLKQFSIVNGGQTTRMIGETPFDDDFFICCKIIKNTFESNEDKNKFISQVAEASNTQKPIKAKDIIANRVEQRNLKTLLSENNIFIEIKRGEKCDQEKYKEVWQRTKNNELAQDLYSFVFMEPGPSRNSVSSLLSNNEKYNIVFKDHKYSIQFIKSLLFLEKAYKDYQKKINKIEDKDENTAIKKGIVKNGQWYFLATIGYILKLYYNPEFKNCMCKYQNNEGMYPLYSSELAFDHSFIDESTSYKDFKKQSYELFDNVYLHFIKNEFECAREKNPVLAYSNWTKSNTGFNEIRISINGRIFYQKDESRISSVTKFFAEIDEETKNKNIDMYVDLCKANKKIKAKNSSNFELNDLDKSLRDNLMIYRMNYCNKNHIRESKVFTDKILDKIVMEKPTTIEQLKLLLCDESKYYCGKDILNIILKSIS